MGRSFHRARRAGLVIALALTGCPQPTTTTTTTGTDSTHGEEASADRSTPIELRDGPELRRLGLVPPGDYLFDPSEDEATAPLRPMRLSRMLGDEIEVHDGRTLVRISRRAAWPRLCLDQAITFVDGAIRVELERGAPVYVLSVEGARARVGLTPQLSRSRVVERDMLTAEGCALASESDATTFVASVAEGDAACLFADSDPIDESDGMAIPSGAAVRTLDSEGAWSHVSVARAGGTIEGWLPMGLISATRATDPDWAEAALRPGRCVFPGRTEPAQASRGWVERSDAQTGAPDGTAFLATLEEAEPRVRACWDELPAEQRPSEGARIEVRIVVDGDGQVSRAGVVRSQSAPAALSRCVIERVGRVRFAPPRTELTLRRTYVFAPAVSGPEGIIGPTAD